MEIQWPLILFTTFLAWSAGLFSAQAGCAIWQKAPKSQFPALVTSVVLLGIGGIAVFLHLQHWERMFNGFGHITSGITQELICVVVIFVMMVVFFSYLRRRGPDQIPNWVCVLSIISGVALVAVSGHSYMMESRPAWDSVLQILSLLGAFCALGPASMAIVMEVRGERLVRMPAVVLAGTVVNAVLAIAYLAYLGTSVTALSELGYYYDPTEIARGMIDLDEITGLFWGGRAALSITVIAASVLSVATAIVKMFVKKFDWRIAGGVIVALTLASTIALRVIFCELGQTVFYFF